MPVVIDCMQRPPSQAMLPLEDRFEVIKEIGDGSFGSVALARVRGAGASVARRGTMVFSKALNVCMPAC
jgi:meiosis induction protein kinase IME2/SME1